MSMTLSEELAWRGFVNQTTYKDPKALDDGTITFYFGVDPSADSMTIGNLAAAMMVRHFIDHGHKAILLVGGATGMIGDPDGKKQERDLKALDEIAQNKKAIAEQYKTVFADQDFEVVDNYDWFKDINYMDFLRDVGKHVPMRVMLGRDFVQSRLGEEGAGISYAEFSYSLIQGYDFLHLHRNKGVSLQLCGADQWGNSIAGVDLIRRITGDETHVWSTPLIINKTTGVKFGKSEDGAVWLDPNKTSPFKFFQFWLNVDDEGAIDYLKVYTLLSKDEIEHMEHQFNEDRASRLAQKTLAFEVTKLIHGKNTANTQVKISDALFKTKDFQGFSKNEFKELELELPFAEINEGDSYLNALVGTGLASSKSEARRLIEQGAVSNSNLIDLTSSEYEINKQDALDGYIVIFKGKKHVGLVKVK
jgi:tyrosyl-tRNA synthetase